MYERKELDGAAAVTPERFLSERVYAMVLAAGDGEGVGDAVRGSGAPVAVCREADGVEVGKGARGSDWAGLGGAVAGDVPVVDSAEFGGAVLVALRALIVNRTEEETAQWQADQRGAGTSGGPPARPGFDLTVQGTPDAVTLAKATAFYLGVPSREAEVAEVKLAGCVVNVVGWVRGTQSHRWFDDGLFSRG